MPAIQSKLRFDGKHAPQDVNQKMKNGSRLRNKDRSSAARNESALESSVKQKKKVCVPELNLNPPNTRLQQKNSTYSESLCKTEIPSPALATVTRSQQPDTSFTNDVTTGDCCMNEIRTSGSVFCLSPNSSLTDVENLNPNKLPENYFDCNEMEEIYRSQYPDFENSSDCTEYGTPKLLEDFPLPSMKSMTLKSCDVTNSPGVLRHFKELLHQEETSRTNLLQQSEVALLKDIVKADERHRRLQRDDYALLREILISQLKEICQQERVIKIALKKIRSRGDAEVEVTTLKVDTAEQPMEEEKQNLSLTKHGPSLRTPRQSRTSSKTPHQEVDISFQNQALSSARSAKDSPATPRDEYELMIKGEVSARTPNKTPRQEVDIIFKNVPSLEKEIRILRSLGMKLEEALNKSSEQASVPPVKRAIILHEVQKRYVAQSSHYSCSHVRPKGVRVLFGQAQEFQIRHQTIDELKLEREFFIPTGIGSFTLQRTDFHKLSSNPELLLRRLRPLSEGSSMKFNFIEQDPMFFNHFLAKLCNIYAENSECHTFIPKPVQSHRRLELLKQDLLSLKNGSGDHKPEIRAVQPQASSSSSMGKRKKKRHYTTPSRSHKIKVTLKNRLIRNILLGALPVSMLFTVAAAIWYPDLICP